LIEITIRKYLLAEDGDGAVHMVPAISGWVKDAANVDVRKLIAAVEAIELPDDFGTVRPMTEEEVKAYKEDEQNNDGLVTVDVDNL
jgi:hypothetical protein